MRNIVMPIGLTFPTDLRQPWRALISRVRRLSKRLSLSLVLVALASCGGGDDFQPTDIEFMRVPAVAFGVWPVQTYTVRTDAEWERAWSTYKTSTMPPPERPQLDFNANVLVGVSLGEGPNGCHRVRILRVTEESRAVRVEYRHDFPDTWSLCTQAIVPLADFVTFTRLEKEVYFVATGG